MLNDVILNYIILFMFLEIYEIQWQKAQTIMGMLARMYQYYHKSIFIFFIKHPTFYFAVGFMIMSDYNIYATSLFAIKALDIGMKVHLIKQVFIDKKLTSELTLALLAPIKPIFLYLGLAGYPILIYLALTSVI